jgi:glucose-1-phosphate adenylyltransferase
VAGLDDEQASKQPFIASMGIYVFKKDVLVQLLKNKYPGSNDFGGEIIPMAAAEGQKVIAYLFNDYWEDIGTMKSFFDANLALAQTVSHLAQPHNCSELSAKFICMVDSNM